MLTRKSVVPRALSELARLCVLECHETSSSSDTGNERCTQAECGGVHRASKVQFTFLASSLSEYRKNPVYPSLAPWPQGWYGRVHRAN